MKHATVGDIQKNFASVLKDLRAGEEIVVLKRGKPIAKLTGLGPSEDIQWPDFLAEAVEPYGDSLSQTIINDREDRF
jgi:antitoxin (DNA-binding transcriptional repressor) of toxin-antitoxin stability system